jgi:EmrB/QacA subfamily drug resistance transporter
LPKDHPNHKWWTLFAMCFALFMIMLDNTVVNVALPSIQRSLKTTPENLEWTVNAYVLVFAALILFGGKLGDRFGRKRMFLAGMVIFTLSSMACALSATDTQLIVFRAVQGSGAALMNPLSLSIIVAAFPPREIPTAIGIWAGISGLGLAIGPLVGGFLVEHFGWSYVFWINVPIGIIATAVTLWAVEETRDPTAKTLDVVGTVLVTAGLFLLVWGLIKTGTHSWTSAYTLGFLGAAAIALVSFVWWESRVESPMIPLDFFRERAFSISSVVVGLIGFALFGAIFFITLYFQNVQGYSALEAGVRTLPNTMMVVLIGPLAGKLNNRFGGRALMTVGMLSASIAMFGLSRLGIHTSYGLIAIFFVLLGSGLAMTMPATTATAMGAVDPRKSGIASGVVNATRQVGGALGIAVLGSIVATLATSHWQSNAKHLSPPAAAVAQRLEPLVVGGQGTAVALIVKPIAGTPAALAARQTAFDSYMVGFRGAMLVGSLLMLSAGALAFFGLIGVRVRRPEGVAAVEV